ncbi:MAG: DUF6470 family protein [Oscillospiraceae bacterium]|nr:DUF6470 family protein [Oscillospiraceae bacterium]
MLSVQRIFIEQQLAEIGIRTTNAQMHITMPQGQMTITSEAPQMQIERRMPTFRVDRQRIADESGLRGPVALARDFANAGRQGAMRGIRNAVDAGHALGDVRRGGDRVGALARNRTMARLTRNREVNIGLMPRSGANLEWDRGEMSINWSRHSLVIDWDGDLMPTIVIDPKHSIEVFLRTEPYFRVVVQGEPRTVTPGRFVDQAV